MSMNIAIDGPAGAGKSTIAKRVAKELGFIYVDTGAMYRAMALYILRHGVNEKEESAVAAVCDRIDVALRYVDGNQMVLLCGEDVSTEIRKEEVGNMASVTSVYPCVRQKLLSLQQDLAAREDVIMDGRDIGTCVLPDAPLKIYLTASVETRAKRRYQELQEKGQTCDLTEIINDIEDREYRDMHREISPLAQAEDAILVDSSDMTIEEVVAKITDLAKERMA